MKGTAFRLVTLAVVALSVAAFVPGAPRSSAFRPSKLFASTKGYDFALLFDCDGVILETEEFHRLAYNEAFEKFDLTIDGERVVWTVRTI